MHVFDVGRGAKAHGTRHASATALGVQAGELVELRVVQRLDRDYAPGEEAEVGPGAERGALPAAPPIPTTTGGKAKGPVEAAVREIVLWRNGFQLGGGALRRYDDPVQAALLAEINQGCVGAVCLGCGIRVVLNVSVLWHLLLGKRPLS